MKRYTLDLPAVCTFYAPSAKACSRGDWNKWEANLTEPFQKNAESNNLNAPKKCESSDASSKVACVAWRFFSWAQ